MKMSASGKPVNARVAFLARPRWRALLMPHKRSTTPTPHQVRVRNGPTSKANRYAVPHRGPPEALRAVGMQPAQRSRPLVGVEGLRPGERAIDLERLVIERLLSVNIAAAGGNASLMTID